MQPSVKQPFCAFLGCLQSSRLLRFTPAAFLCGEEKLTCCDDGLFDKWMTFRIKLLSNRRQRDHLEFQITDRNEVEL